MIQVKENTIIFLPYPSTKGKLRQGQEDEMRLFWVKLMKCVFLFAG